VAAAFDAKDANPDEKLDQECVDVGATVFSTGYKTRRNKIAK
jgi:hypothetical protein